MIGLDMEWQPTFGCTSSQQVALIQLAISDQVFLLDLQADGLSQQPDTVAFVRSLFSNRDVLKVGQWTDIHTERDAHTDTQELDACHHRCRLPP